MALDTPVASDWIVRALFRLRGLGSMNSTIGEFSSKGGFLALERTPTEYVFGLAGRLWGWPRRTADVDGWRDWSAPGIKIAADLRAVPAGEGRTRLSTETRVLTLDGWSRIIFRTYWLVVGPFSALIRRRWLKAIADRAREAAGR